MNRYQVVLEVDRYNFRWFAEPFVTVEYHEIVVNALNNIHAEALAKTTLTCTDCKSIQVVHCTELERSKYKVLFEYRVFNQSGPGFSEETSVHEILAYDAHEAKKIAYCKFREGLNLAQTKYHELRNTVVSIDDLNET